MSAATEEWVTFAVVGKHITPECRLATAIDMLNGRPDVVRPLVVMVNSSVDPGMFARMDIKEVRLAPFVPITDVRFLKVRP